MKLTACNICPRACGVDRSEIRGFCGEGKPARVAKTMLHRWEEPCISGEGGSGAIFFSGCSLKCVYCQNGAISRDGKGESLSASQLAELMLELQAQGAENINLVTPTHFASQIREALALLRGKLHIPTVWNTSGYETVETLRSLEGMVDIFLTDFKYFSAELAARYSAAPDYPDVAAKALLEMVRITGVPVLEGGKLLRGTVVRHLVLPSHYRDSLDVLRQIDSLVGASSVLLSLMAQYTPEFLRGDFPELSRRITTYEYQKVADEALRLGFDGFFQERDSATDAFTPDF